MDLDDGSDLENIEERQNLDINEIDGLKDEGMRNYQSLRFDGDYYLENWRFNDS